MGRHKDAKDFVEGTDFSSDAFSFAIIDVLLNLCDPFTDDTKSDLVKSSLIIESTNRSTILPIWKEI